MFLTVGDIRLHFEDSGGTQPALLLAGWPQTSFAWRHVVPRLVAAGRRTIVLDPRGFGESDKPSGGYDLDTVADDVHGFLANLQLAAGAIDVVSHDVGSWIAYALASAHPADVGRLVLSEMTLPTPDAERPFPPSDAENIGLWHFGFNRLPDLPEALVAGRERVFLDWLFDHKAARPEAIDDRAREHYARCFAAPSAARAGFDYYRELQSREGLARMQERRARPLPMPVLAIGAERGVGPRLAQSLAEAAPDLESVVLPAGHYLPEEDPAAFAAAVTDFWKRTDARDGTHR